MRKWEIIGRESYIPFVGIWTDETGFLGFYARTRRWRFYAGPMFGRVRLERA